MEKGRFREIVAFVLQELKPKGKILTPFNVITAPIIVLGGILIVFRLVKGLGATTNLSQDFPWGIWIGFDVMTGVAFAGGAYCLTFVVYVLRCEKYHPIIRATVLNGLLAYMFYAGAIFLDLGRWWNIFNPIIGNKFGYNSVLFLVAWHFLLYMLTELTEFSPVIAEWLGLERVRKVLNSLTLGAVIFGITLSTLHQSGLGALVLMAKGKIHPLWYSQFIPVLYLVSSVFAGLSMVIFEGSISHRVFRHQLDEEHHRAHEEILIGLGRACAVTMFAYLFLKALVFVHEHGWLYINSPMGYWYLVEVIGLVLIPAVVFSFGVRARNLFAIKAAALAAMIGIIINRFNYVFIAYKWYLPWGQRYFPSWMEIVMTMAIVFAEIWAFRWVVNRMPVLRSSPHVAHEAAEGDNVIGREVAQWKASGM